MQPFNRIDVVVSHGVTAAVGCAVTEHMLPCSRVSGDDHPVAAPGVDPLNAPQDEVVISPAARLLQSQDVGAAARAERLAEIRAQISQGVYDTPEKLALAVDRLVQDLNRR